MSDGMLPLISSHDTLCDLLFLWATPNTPYPLENSAAVHTQHRPCSGWTGPLSLSTFDQKRCSTGFVSAAAIFARISLVLTYGVMCILLRSVLRTQLRHRPCGGRAAATEPSPQDA